MGGKGNPNLMTLMEAAEHLGTDRFTVGGLVRALGIEPKRVPHSGHGKGLDRRDIARIARALGHKPGRKAAAVPAPA